MVKRILALSLLMVGLFGLSSCWVEPDGEELDGGHTQSGGDIPDDIIDDAGGDIGG